MSLTDHTLTGTGEIVMKVATIFTEIYPSQGRPYGTQPWGQLSEPIDIRETHIISRAQSILTMDGKPGPRLPYAQALDVVNWHGKTQQF